MSRNSKNFSHTLSARAMSATRKGGGKGPALTSAKHGKSRDNRAACNVHPRPAGFPASSKQGSRERRDSYVS